MKPIDSDNTIVMSPGKAPKMARATTLAQIAEHVGVSKVAVSVVLNKSRSEVRVSEKTRQRILDAARELDYQPNDLARSLQRRSTNVIGFYDVQRQVPDPLYPFYGYLLKGLLKGCEAYKKNFLIHGTFEGLNEDEIYLELLNGQIDGLIIYARQSTPLTERLAASHLPVITLASDIPNLPCVTVDAQQGGYLLARHLAKKGYKSVTYWIPSKTLHSNMQLRLDSFLNEAALHNINVEVFYPKTLWPPTKDIEQLMSQKEPPQAIVAFSDFTANFLVCWCRENGLRVPEDIAITGFDGYSGVFGYPTGLTSIRASWDVVAQKAVALLVEQCNGTAIPMNTVFPVELIEGQTT